MLKDMLEDKREICGKSNQQPKFTHEDSLKSLAYANKHFIIYV